MTLNKLGVVLNLLRREAKIRDKGITNRRNKIPSKAVFSKALMNT
jgi:hypothetical protein